MTTTHNPTSPEQSAAPRALRVAVVGAGMAGITCARTLAQAGCAVTVFEKSRGFGGRMATRHTEFGNFDHGAQYFTARDDRFIQALQTATDVVVPWSANSVRVLDEHGQVLDTTPPPREAHYVAAPGMNALVRRWGQPLEDAGVVELNTKVTHIEADALNKKLKGVHIFKGTECDILLDGSLDYDEELLAGFDYVVAPSGS